MTAHPLLKALRARGGREAIVSSSASISYEALADRVALEVDDLARRAIGPTVILDGDFSIPTITEFLALILHRAILVPTARILAPERAQRIAVTQADAAIDPERGKHATLPQCAEVRPALIEELRTRRHAGLVLFTSGSSGTPKAAVHDLDMMLARHLSRERPALRTCITLLADHIGGVNTLLHTFAQGGTLIVPDARTPQAVCRAIAQHRAELLPTTPSFLRLLLVTGAWRDHDLSSLRVVTYGTEPMSDATLIAISAALPHVEFRQTYGLSELGILQAQSRDRSSRWVRVGGAGYETRVREGLLEVRAATAMLGYLNAPSPFDADGWFATGDIVEQDGEWLRILGRASDLINVGGAKVVPADIEAVLCEMPGIRDAVVYGEPNAVLGQIVAARVVLDTVAAPVHVRPAVQAWCRERVPAHAVPLRVTVASEVVGARGKKLRR